MHDGQGTPQVTNNIQAQANDDYHDGNNRKQFKYPCQLVSGPNNKLSSVTEINIS